jgi:trimeric autotransporter adhesin
MKTSPLSRSTRPALATLLAAALLAACSGGDDDGAATALATLSGRAVDGPLQGAIACYDLDDDGACGSAEPRSAPTSASGAFILQVPAARAGRHAVVVEVPASAVDADTGAAVGRAFVLRVPPTGTAGDHAVFASPLSTLVLAHMRATGAGLAEATAHVQQQARLAVSPLADFTGNAPGMAEAAALARLVQLTANEQAAALDALLGSTDREGRVITAAVVERQVHEVLLGALGALRDAASDSTISAALGAEREAALRQTAGALAAALGPDADAVRLAGTLQKLAEPPVPNPPVATAQLLSFQYTDARNWLIRSLQSSAADNVTDANGYRRFTDWRIRSSGNVFTGTALMTADIVNPGGTINHHWNGTAWVTRQVNDRYLSRLRDAQGRSDFIYGDNLEAGVGIRRVLDISGEDMEFVVRDRIRGFAGSSNGTAYANWGPFNLSLYSGAVFPPGSYLIYQTNTVTSSAFQYPQLASNEVLLYPAAIAAGGDTRSNPGLACNGNASVLDPQRQAATSLEELVSRNTGTPCTYNQGGTSPNLSLVPNEWWGNSTLNLGDLANTNTLPAGTGNHYTTTATLRVSFAASGNRVRFWRCYRRASDSSPRNCSLLGIGTWAIQTLGDGRVLTFSTAPALAQRLGYARVFVERGGKVYFGSKNPVGVANTDLRLGTVAANAVLEQLGLPRLQPITQPGTATGARAATLATLQGAWGDASATDALVFRFGPNGRFFLAEAKPFASVTSEQSGAELGWFDFDPATGRASTQLQVDSNLTSGTSHPSDSDPPLTITATSISDGSFSIGRLPTAVAANSLVGLWAVDSPTDLSVPHLAFFANGRSMLVIHSTDTQCLGGTAPSSECPPGVEFADYGFDPASGTVVFSNLTYNTLGCQGWFRSCPTSIASQSALSSRSLTFNVAADGRTLTFLDDDGVTRTAYRVEPAAPSTLTQVLLDPFDGFALSPTRWAANGDFAVGASLVEFQSQGSASTQGRVTLQGQRIVVEARMAGQGSGRNTHVTLVDADSGDAIVMGDTSYFGWGFYANGSGAYNFVEVERPSGVGPAPQNCTTLGGTTAQFMDYRLSIQGQTVTIERATSLPPTGSAGNPSGDYQSATRTLGTSMTGRRFYLRIGTAVAPYAPGTFDSVRVLVSTLD